MILPMNGKIGIEDDGQQSHEEQRGRHEPIALAAHSFVAVFFDDGQNIAYLELAQTGVVELHVGERLVHVAVGTFVVATFENQSRQVIESCNLASGRLIVVDGRLCEAVDGLVLVVQIDIRPRHLGQYHGAPMGIGIGSREIIPE